MRHPRSFPQEGELFRYEKLSAQRKTRVAFGQRLYEINETQSPRGAPPATCRADPTHANADLTERKQRRRSFAWTDPNTSRIETRSARARRDSMYAYIYTERGREKERDRQRDSRDERERDSREREREMVLFRRVACRRARHRRRRLGARVARLWTTRRRRRRWAAGV